jgi:hypothetical protein
MNVWDGSQWIEASAASQAILVVYQYTATGGQTTFSGTDNNSLTLGYTVGSALVTLNGVMLEVGSEVTATSGTSVVLASGATAGDELNVYAFSTFNLADVYTKAQSDARYPQIDTNTLFTDTANDRVGVGTSSPLAKLHIEGSSSGAVQAFIENANGSTNSSAELVFGTWSGAIPTGTGNPGPSAKISAINMGSSNARTDIVFSNYTGSVLEERMRIDSSGRVTMPYQPAFSAYRQAGHVGGTAGATTTIVFNTVWANTGSHYNNTNGIFTAPVSGVYYFSSIGMMTGSGSSAHDTQLRIRKNGGGFVISNPPGETSGGMGFAASGVVYLAAGDYVYVEWYCSSTYTLYASGGDWNNFSGYLIG